MVQFQVLLYIMLETAIQLLMMLQLAFLPFPMFLQWVGFGPLMLQEIMLQALEQISILLKQLLFHLKQPQEKFPEPLLEPEQILILLFGQIQ
ncbi:MAG: hypothetical protein DRO11_06785 [Methanobacteriota archaeon]|nr:MAG: hypothetical protein DRO11_06785 [Euryarchaeota archaeon]